MISKRHARAEADAAAVPILQSEQRGSGDEGFMLLAAIVLIFMVLLALSVAAPRMAMALKHDQELETQHRANQYVRAIRIYYRKFGHYPPSIEALEKTNNQRFLRQRYLDPLTGKDDWRLIKQGENKTTVKGFFGEDLPGIASGLGALAGSSSNLGPGLNGGTPGSAFGSGPGNGAGNGTGSVFGSSGNNGPGVGSFGSSGNNGPGGGSGSGTGSSPSGTNGSGGTSGSSDGTVAGPFMGVGVPKDGVAMLTVNEQTNYQEWEFLYDPRIEQLYAKGNLLGGGGIGSGGTSTGLGSGNGNGLGTGTGTGNGNSNPSGFTPVGTAPPTAQPQ